MRRLPAITPFILTIAVLCTACGDHPESSFDSGSLGYSLEVPDNWIALSRHEIKENPDLFEDFEKMMLDANVDPSAVDHVADSIRSGKTDMYFRSTAGNSDFVDNINVFKQIQKLPSKQDQLDQVCESLPDDLTNAFGRPINVFVCRFDTLDDHHAVYAEFDGVLSGTRTVQYQVAKSENVTLIVSATFLEQRSDEFRREFTEIMTSFKVE